MKYKTNTRALRDAAARHGVAPSSVQGEIDTMFIADLKAMRARIKDNWSLCEFMAGYGLRANEKEYMVAETIHAACLNLDSEGEPFSWVGANVRAVHGGGLVDNATAYGYLVSEGYFREEKRKGKPVIFPTRRLLDALTAFFKVKQ